MIFDSTFFIRQLGVARAKEAIGRAKELLESKGYPGGAYMMAVNPAIGSKIEGRDVIRLYGAVGFDAITHYVYLPDWKGDYLQDYGKMASLRASRWGEFKAASGLPYYPSVATGWDATARGAIFKRMRPRRYPWWPVITGNTPELFERFLKRAVAFSLEQAPVPLTFVASWNEWSEGHYLEPCCRWGFGWLNAVKRARKPPCHF